MAPGDSGILVRPRGMLLLLNPRKLMSLQWARSCVIAAAILHFEMVASASKVADVQRVGMLSSLAYFHILMVCLVHFTAWLGVL